MGRSVNNRISSDLLFSEEFIVQRKSNVDDNFNFLLMQSLKFESKIIYWIQMMTKQFVFYKKRLLIFAIFWKFTLKWCNLLKLCVNSLLGLVWIKNIKIWTKSGSNTSVKYLFLREFFTLVGFQRLYHTITIILS